VPIRSPRPAALDPPVAAAIGTGCDPIRYLEGAWLLERELLDERTGATGTFTGTAVFTERSPGVLSYREAGELVWPGYRGPAERSLGFEQGAGTRLHVLFADGRPFHDLELLGEGFDAEHLCKDDRYLGRFVLSSPTRWTARWRVTGPAKSLVLASRYERSCSATERSDAPIGAAPAPRSNERR
jgi:hypothetical protein